MSYQGEYDLFDTIRYVRKIKISDLLGIDNFDSMKKILGYVKECDEVVVCFDYLPSSKFWICRKFLLRRILQCLEFIHSNFNETYKKIKLHVKNPQLVKKQLKKIMEEN